MRKRKITDQCTSAEKKSNLVAILQGGGTITECIKASVHFFFVLTNILFLFFLTFSKRTKHVLNTVFFGLWFGECHRDGRLAISDQRPSLASLFISIRRSLN